METGLMPFFFVKPRKPIWDIMIYKNIHTPSTDEYDFIQDDANHYGENESATSVIEYASRFLRETWVGETLSDAMEELSLDRDTVILDTLKSNLYCILLLEAMGQTSPDESASTLTELIWETSLDYAELSKTLSTNFPDILKELFAIEEKRQPSDPYKISTRYPELFLAELQHWRTAPLTGENSTAASYKYNMKFYQGCMGAIAPNGIWTKNSFAQYYLFERFFRLNAKHILFWGEYDCPDKEASVSPAFLADCLFQSPLVLFPHEVLPKLLYEKWEDIPLHERQAYTLNLPILLSARWFFVILSILRNYMCKHNIVSPEDVHTFFFPEPDDFSKFVMSVKPISKIKMDEVINNRKLQNTYSQRWSAFVPAEPASLYHPHLRVDRLAFINAPDNSFRRTLIPLTMQEWEMKSITESQAAVDQAILTIMQDRLY